MKVAEFINTFMFASVYGRSGQCSKPTMETMQTTYSANFLLLPRIYCMDGFNISIQVNRGNYCASENGTREFGLTWQEVEWGFPSEQIDGVKFNAEDEDNTMGTVGAFVPMNLIEGLVAEHGGLDLQTTLQKEMENNVVVLD